MRRLGSGGTKMKGIVGCVMLAALMVGLSACGKSEDGKGNGTQQRSGGIGGGPLQKGGF